MFNHVEAGRILEQPAGKDLAPGQRLIRRSAFLHENLHEGAGFGRTFPRQAALTRGQLDRHIADPLRLTGFKNHVLREIVALVQQTQRGDAVLYRRAIFVFHDLAGRRLCGHFAGNFGRFGIGSVTAVAGGQGQRRGKQEQPGAHHASGDQASYAVS